MTLVRYDRLDHPAVRNFQDFVADRGYPCVGAKAALGNASSSFYVARDIRSNWDDLGIHRSVCNFVTRVSGGDSGLRSHVVIFESGETMDERAFEAALWERLSSISQKDKWLGFPHDDAVSADPQADDFGVSIGGTAFFVVGLHPGASRPARRFDQAAMVFNLHSQFATMKADGRYAKMQKTIRERDEALAGSINPMLAAHGEISEARQYSGRAVGPDWRCPFSREIIDAQRAA